MNTKEDTSIQESKSPPRIANSFNSEDKVLHIDHGSIQESTTTEYNGIKVHPQPTSDPLDPLNWSKLQKNTILGIVMFKYVHHIYTCSISHIYVSNI